MEGVKFDKGKARWGLLPFEQVEHVVDVLTFGSKKYADDNWKYVANSSTRYFDAMMRHIAAYKMGEVIDDETGESHLAHAMCCALFLMWGDDNQEPDQRVSIEDKLKQINDLTPDSSCDIPSKLAGVGVASLSTSPQINTDELVKSIDNILFDIETGVGVGAPRPEINTIPIKKANCCYSNFGNCEIVRCSPEKILSCMQSELNANPISVDWVNIEYVKQISENRYKYIGKNCTSQFIFELFDGIFTIL